MEYLEEEAKQLKVKERDLMILMLGLVWKHFQKTQNNKIIMKKGVQKFYIVECLKNCNVLITRRRT